MGQINKSKNKTKNRTNGTSKKDLGNENSSDGSDTVGPDVDRQYRGRRQVKPPHGTKSQRKFDFKIKAGSSSTGYLQDDKKKYSPKVTIDDSSDGRGGSGNDGPREEEYKPPKFKRFVGPSPNINGMYKYALDLTGWKNPVGTIWHKLFSCCLHFLVTRKVLTWALKNVKLTSFAQLLLPQNFLKLIGGMFAAIPAVLIVDLVATMAANMFVNYRKVSVTELQIDSVPAPQVTDVDTRRDEYTSEIRYEPNLARVTETKSECIEVAVCGLTATYPITSETDVYLAVPTAVAQMVTSVVARPMSTPLMMAERMNFSTTMAGTTNTDSMEIFSGEMYETSNARMAFGIAASARCRTLKSDPFKLFQQPTLPAFSPVSVQPVTSVISLGRNGLRVFWTLLADAVSLASRGLGRCTAGMIAGFNTAIGAMSSRLPPIPTRVMTLNTHLHSAWNCLNQPNVRRWLLALALCSTTLCLGRTLRAQTLSSKASANVWLMSLLSSIGTSVEGSGGLLLNFARTISSLLRLGTNSISNLGSTPQDIQRGVGTSFE